MEVRPAPTVADLFAGAGGFSLGFAQADCRIALAVERDDWACETFRHNHPEALVLQEDIEKLSESELKDLGPEGLDILLGGPPCQGFSVSSNVAGDPKDPRNSLFMEMVRVADLWSPGIIVMENVPGLLRRKTESGSPVIDVICGEFSGLGYSVDYGILRAMDFGVPQIRERLFVVGTRFSATGRLPAPTHRPPTAARNAGRLALVEDAFDTELPEAPVLWDAISDLPPLEAGEGDEEMDYAGTPLTDYQRMMRMGSSKLFNHVAMNHTKRMVARFAAMRWGDSVSNVPDEHRPHKKGNPSARAPRTYDQNNRRMHPHRPCHTLAASFYANFVHPFQHRNFTPREGARIQSFPDTYCFIGRPTVVSHKLLAREGRHSEMHLCQYNQIGNAVAPMVARTLARHLLSIAGLQERERVCVSARGEY